MDKDIRKKVLLDIFAVTIIPVVGGTSVLMLAWAAGAGPLLTFLGLGGILGGIGWLSTRLIFGIEKLTEDAYNEIKKVKEQKRERELDDLDTKLVSGRDPRDQEALRSLRAMEQQLQQQVKDGKADSGIVEKLNELFVGCVTQLKQCAELWDTARSLSGEGKKKILASREQIIVEVVKTVEFYGTTLEEMKMLHIKASGSADLSEKRDELERSLEIAKRVEQRMSGLGRSDKTYDEAEFQ